MYSFFFILEPPQGGWMILTGWLFSNWQWHWISFNLSNFIIYIECYIFYISGLIVCQIWIPTDPHFLYLFSLHCISLKTIIAFACSVHFGLLEMFLSNQ